MRFPASFALTLTVLCSLGVMAKPGVAGKPSGTGKGGPVNISWESTSIQDQGQNKTIEIRSVPPGASVRFDGTIRGVTPLTIPGVGIGPHPLELNMKDYFAYATTIQVRDKNEPFVYRLVKPAVLIVNSNLPQCEVLVEDIFYGRTNYQAQFQPGEINIRVKKSGYFDSLFVVNLVEGERREIKVDLRPRVARGSLLVTSNPTGADIYLDARFVGKSPIKIPDLATGTHVIRTSKVGYEDVVKEGVVVTGDPNQSINIDLTSPLLPPARQLVTLEIEVEPAAATLTLDDTSLTNIAGKASASTRPGRHVVRASMNGYVTQEVTIELVPGKSQRIPVKLEVKTGSNFLYYLAGGGVAIVGGYFLYKKLTAKDEKPPIDLYGTPPALPNPSQ